MTYDQASLIGVSLLAAFVFSTIAVGCYRDLTKANPSPLDAELARLVDQVDHVHRPAGTAEDFRRDLRELLDGAVSVDELTDRWRGRLPASTPPPPHSVIHFSYDKGYLQLTPMDSGWWGAAGGGGGGGVVCGIGGNGGSGVGR